MPESPPKGIFPMFVRGVTAEKYGFKTGEGVNDLVSYLLLKKEDITKEIQTLGVMSDFEPAKKYVDSYSGDVILFVIDKTQKYGETFLLCYTDEAKEDFMKSITENEEAMREQLLAEQRAEEERKAAEFARLNVVYEDKPIACRPWLSSSTQETENEIKLLSLTNSRELISIEVSRSKKSTKQKINFTDRHADVAEFRAHKDPNFKPIRESDLGIQVGGTVTSTAAQTSWFRSVNKAVQYESSQIRPELGEGENKEKLLEFLEKVVVRIESSLQQNESVDIFSETFRLIGDDEALEGVQVENELRELKNFADPNYSKFKVLAAIDWLPKSQGLVAVSAVRNVSFDQRVTFAGQTYTSYILLWDFRLLVKPLLLMQSPHEIFTFRFNKTNPGIIVGGCITGQVVLWDINDSMASALSNAQSGNSSDSTKDEEDTSSAPIVPKFISNVDSSHKRCVADLFWLPPTTQINYRGQIVGDEHLDGNSYQFITVAGDGLIMVWDIRYEKISNDELRHIGRAKHVPTEKSSSKEGGAIKPLWGPIFKAHLKRLEGVSELSLCKVCETVNSKTSALSLSKGTNFSGDSRSQFLIATEEGDVIFADLSARRAEVKNDDEGDDEDGETTKEFVKWIAVDHARPCVSLQESPFFPQILLSVSDWNFHIWKSGEDKPLFTSPMSNSYLTSGAWSPTRPAVLFVACADGQILVWDFTDSSFRPSIELKATHSKITSMEFLPPNANQRYQLIAIGDEDGTLHVFEVPRNLTKPIFKEDQIMLKFLDRELQRIEFSKNAQSKEENIDEVDDFNSYRNLNNNDAKNDNSNMLNLTEDLQKNDRTVLTKEDEEFLKLESIFISEIGLKSDQLPSFINQTATATTTETKIQK
eukprot:gene4926-6893_t